MTVLKIWLLCIGYEVKAKQFFFLQTGVSSILVQVSAFALHIRLLLLVSQRFSIPTFTQCRSLPSLMWVFTQCCSLMSLSVDVYSVIVALYHHSRHCVHLVSLRVGVSSVLLCKSHFTQCCFLSHSVFLFLFMIYDTNAFIVTSRPVLNVQPWRTQFNVVHAFIHG